MPRCLQVVSLYLSTSFYLLMSTTSWYMCMSMFPVVYVVLGGGGVVFAHCKKKNDVPSSDLYRGVS